MATNDRGRIRVNFSTKVFIGQPEGPTLEGWLDNISLNGALLRTEHTIPLDSKCFISIPLGSNKTIFTLTMDAHVVRKIEDGFAVQFDDMSEGTMESLKRIVMYNTNQLPDFEQELVERPGFK